MLTNISFINHKVYNLKKICASKYRFQKIYLSALTMLTGHSLATRNSLRSLSRAASLNQHSSHFGEISASMIFNYLSVADIKSSSPHLNTLHIQILLKISFFAIYNHDTLCSRQPYYKQIKNHYVIYDKDWLSKSL